MNIVSFFSGAGGLDLGFQQAGLMLFGQMNMIKKFGKLMKKNHPNTFLDKKKYCKYSI